MSTVNIYHSPRRACAKVLSDFRDTEPLVKKLSTGIRGPVILILEAFEVVTVSIMLTLYSSDHEQDEQILDVLYEEVDGEEGREKPDWPQKCSPPGAECFRKIIQITLL